MCKYQLSFGEGKTEVKLRASKEGNDLVVIITAGRAHVGAVALAVPCEKTPEGVTASSSVLTVPGHRDNIPAEQAALKLCKAFKRPVSVTAGLHIDHATEEEIQELMYNSQEVVEKLLVLLKGK